MTSKPRQFLLVAAVVSLMMRPAFLSAQAHALPPASLMVLPDEPSESVLQQQGSSTQQPSSTTPSGAQQQQEPGPDTKLPETSKLEQSSSQTPVGLEQPKRILWIIPNYRAVSADAQVPPLDAKGKFKLFFDDSFDYSTFLYVGILAGIGQAENSTPEFHQGAAGYARYYWHFFADQAVGNAFTEFIVPLALKQDPRYFTKGHGGFFNRTGYAISRLAVTRTDSGGNAPNFSEIVGNGAAAGISSFYYPSQERTWTKIGQRWLDQVALDGVFNVLKEFWPDIAHSVFHK
jgi:hypothetical protein